MSDAVGVSKRFLLRFMEEHNVLNVPTHQVVEDIIKAKTLPRLWDGDDKVSFVDVWTQTAGNDGQSDVGPANVFVSHAWGNDFGLTVLAAVDGVSDSSDQRDGQWDTFFWLDIFVVPQHAESKAIESRFDQAIQACRYLICVCPHMPDLLQLEELESICARDLTEELKRNLPLYRVWCLFELSHAIKHHIPVILKVGTVVDSRLELAKGGTIEEDNIFYPLYSTVDVEEFSFATDPKDKDYLLQQVLKKNKLTTKQLNGQIIGFLTGAEHLRRFPQIARAVIEENMELLRPLSGHELQHAFVAASAYGHIQPVQFMLESLGADVNSKNDDGWTALMAAAQGGHLEIVRLLLEKGADSLMRDESESTDRITGKVLQDGCQAIYFAKQFEHDEVAAVLRRHMRAQRCNSFCCFQ